MSKVVYRPTVFKTRIAQVLPLMPQPAGVLTTTHRASDPVLTVEAAEKIIEAHVQRATPERAAQVDAALGLKPPKKDRHSSGYMAAYMREYRARKKAGAAKA